MVKQRCQSLRARGYSIAQIAKRLRLSKSTVHWHVHQIRLTDAQRENLRRQKRNLMVTVNARRRGKPMRILQFRRPLWSTDLVHLVAHLSFDGRVDRYGCCYYSRSHTQALHVTRLLEQLLDIKPSVRQRSNGIWIVSCYHVGLAAWLLRKENELLTVIRSRTDWQQQWLQALFDDEGHVYFSKHVKRVRASQRAPGILQHAQQFLRMVNIESWIDKRARAVEIRGRNNLFRFSKWINFSSGLAVNPARTNGLWSQPIEKRKLLDLALRSYKTTIALSQLGR